ncbi:hypothetical protein [Streptomyces sp. NPDC086782]|uniref:zinc finger domain-containing protein n=1 Tax=Streptomyces sp. NPDC086782 TaxID=3365757 RepID=UPI003812F08E
MEQLRSLLGHTESRALTTAEAERLRTGVEHLLARKAGLTAETARLTRRLANGARPALDVGCPTCQAATGCPCVNRFGHPIPAPHARRLNAAALPTDHRKST